MRKPKTSGKKPLGEPAHDSVSNLPEDAKRRVTSRSVTKPSTEGINQEKSDSGPGGWKCSWTTEGGLPSESSSARPEVQAGVATMAIIRVNTVGEARPPQPAVPSLQEGVPLDFEFYARRTYGGKNAVQKALRAIAESIRSPHTESVATPESVVSENLRTHPCLYADAAAIHANERVPDKWLPLVNQRRELIRRVLRSVGRIQLYHATRKLASSGYEIGLIIGTGFVVAPGVVMTNRRSPVKAVCL